MSRKSLGKITSEEKKKSHNLIFSVNVERSQKKGYFVFRVTLT